MESKLTSAMAGGVVLTFAPHIQVGAMKLGDLRFHSFTHMTEQLYYKKGRRYYPWGTTDSWDHERDALKAGSCRLTYCPAPGHYRYRYDVTPDSAAWMAAAMVAEHAMQEAMAQKATATPCDSLVYTEEQKQILEKFRKDMAAAGGLIPPYWTHGTPAEIAKAGVDAVANFVPVSSNPETK